MIKKWAASPKVGYTQEFVDQNIFFQSNGSYLSVFLGCGETMSTGDMMMAPMLDDHRQGLPVKYELIQ